MASLDVSNPYRVKITNASVTSAKSCGKLLAKSLRRASSALAFDWLPKNVVRTV
jgi:hypothetical protein